MTEDLPDRRPAVRDLSAVVRDFPVECDLPPLGALEHEHGSEGFGQVAEKVGCVGPRGDASIDVREPQSAFPDDRSILEQSAGQSWNARGLPEQLDIALERGRTEIEGTLLPGRHDDGQGGGEDQPGNETAGNAHRLSLTEAPQG